VLIDEFGLGDNIALDPSCPDRPRGHMSEDRQTDPLAAGLEAIGAGGILAESDDQVLLAKGSFVHDALYAWCEHEVEASGQEPVASARRRHGASAGRAQFPRSTGAGASRCLARELLRLFHRWAWGLRFG
jgi:hypothetical protein